jgi:hypothetical protein
MLLFAEIPDPISSVYQRVRGRSFGDRARCDEKGLIRGAFEADDFEMEGPRGGGIALAVVALLVMLAAAFPAFATPRAHPGDRPVAPHATVSTAR